MASPNETLAIRKAMEAHDVEAVVDCFAPNAVVYSPFTARTSFRGREQIRMLTSVVLEVADGFRYTSEVRGENEAYLRSAARIDGRDIEFVDHLRFGTDGLIEELTLFARPLPAAAVGLRVIGAALGRRNSAARGAVISVLAAPLGLMTRVGDAVGIALVRPALETASPE
ncbi:MAG TPA: nuclear transport factor 2 family protein [Acidimicrobiales bacterium]|nr:nuclear transport factor 2 family protein [Acidimicrobiales bacterium]